MTEPFLLFDDARAGGSPARLYRAPHRIIIARYLNEVADALGQLQAAVVGGAHAAGFLAYEAGIALDDALAPAARESSDPLLWFGLFDSYEEIDAASFLPSSDGGWASAPRPRLARSDYLAAAAQVREHLFAGDFYQANLTFNYDVSIAGEPLALYARMRQAGAASWGGIVRHEDGWLLSCSPEQFFTLRNGVIEAKPMKGTAPLSAPPEELTGDPKNRAENLMIVDLLRNDLARVAEPGSVEVPELFKVETYPTLRQMVSRVTARLRPGLDAVDVLRTIFPCGSVTGAPKVAAMLALRRLEREPRGAYTGSMGWIDPNGDASFNVLIRTLVIGRDEHQARLGLGSGLVVDSDSGDEWAECLAKGAFVTAQQANVDLIETMRFDPREGVLELDRHLDRLGSSARALGFNYDRHAARNELQAATFSRKLPGVARLLLSPTGVMAVELRGLPAAAHPPVPVALRPLPVAPNDFRLHHKTTDRAFYDQAREDGGAFETLFVDQDGKLTEGTFTSLFVERDGKLLTPPASRGLLAGVLRAKLLDEGRAVEADLTPGDLEGGFLIGNMVRGLIPARLA
ncbi:aminodeoxychorismate synthase component I [Sphingomonas sp. KRR8]|uniref:aminodeoxychorismate synthase component I n=1 Tax=Sphingomonas sp. KRR8 TaxID=2942996 RepID=UPI0020227FA3|nr:aminodeoxychorismate synthase component I [Sphingomonas sp. KRR8]URD59986.1 aminodeoxychorismate synthase component I [Sphingomonas sp. KRR8]